MNIPKSYEALAADLASEKILSKTLLGQKEAYMKLADKGGLDLSESKAREAALREDLESIKASVDGYDSPEHAAQVADEMGYQCDALQQRLTVAEQLMQEFCDRVDRGEVRSKTTYAKFKDALKPAAQHQGYPVNRLSYSQGDRRYVNGWNDACSHWEVRSAPEAHESECTSCDGSGEYTDAIGDWRGYCTCPAGVDAEGIKGLKP